VLSFLAAPFAELQELDFLLELFVLAGPVIDALAIRANQFD